MSGLEFCGDTIEISIETSYCGCCGNDHDTEYMPISYLWDEEWQKEIPGILAERKAAAERKKVEDERKRLVAQEKAERAQLAKLQAKYQED